mgnify:CR=1 FL=1
MGYSDAVKATGKITSKVANLFNEKLVQIALVGGILFFVVANPAIFRFVDNSIQRVGSVFGLDLKVRGTNALVLHSVVFSVLLVVSVRYILNPVMEKLK